MFKKLVSKAVLGPMAAMIERPTNKLWEELDAKQLCVELLASAWPVIHHHLPYVSLDDILAWVDVHLGERLVYKDQMLVDILVGRETEIDLTTGWIITKLKSLDSQLTLRVMIDLVKAEQIQKHKDIQAAKRDKYRPEAKATSGSSDSKPTSDCEIEPWTRRRNRN
ncbi:hypothetical protein N431DRAFT_453732 [Stipitochalara longipes BDJ]|nr:hypothetical protein N431DRAFT_453732 [Stipitochalara longipes BDJ]